MNSQTNFRHKFGILSENDSLNSRNIFFVCAKNYSNKMKGYWVSVRSVGFCERFICTDTFKLEYFYMKIFIRKFFTGTTKVLMIRFNEVSYWCLEIPIRNFKEIANKSMSAEDNSGEKIASMTHRITPC